MAVAERIRVEVAYAGEGGRHILLPVEVDAGASVREAIIRSGILQRCPDIDLGHNRVGIFARLCELDTVLEDRDRVEIYRPLLLDPKEARRQRAKAG